MKRKIIVYTMTNCYFCIAIKKWLQEKGVIFEERNVIESELYRKEFEDLKGIGTPLTVIEENDDFTTIPGFNPKKLEKILFD